MTIFTSVSRGETHPGTKRAYNQDTFVQRDDLGLWAVADGAGGHKGGELAAGMLCDALNAVPAGLSASQMLARVRLAVAEVHERLRSLAADAAEPIAGASTIVTLIIREDHFACLWAGDSRAYLLREGVLRRVTHDHSLVQELIDAGVISEAQAEKHPQANVITRAVGADVDDFALDKVTERLRAGDVFLLCSDGLYKCVPEDDIAAILIGSTGVPAPQMLIATAVAMNATDNVTAVVVQAAAP